MMLLHGFYRKKLKNILEFGISSLSWPICVGRYLKFKANSEDNIKSKLIISVEFTVIILGMLYSGNQLNCIIT